MKLYRLVHKKMVNVIEKEHFYGCALHNGFPYFYLFNSIPSAVLESSVYYTLLEIPPTIVAVQYTVPEDSIFDVEEKHLFGKYNQGNNYLGSWTEKFLKDKTALLAIFTSKHFAWMDAQNYIVNPKHELFHQIKITDIQNIRRN